MTDQDLLSQLQSMLMEPPDGGQTYPSGLWTKQEILNRLNERSNRFRKVTRFSVVAGAPIPVAAGQSRVLLPQDWLATFDVFWQGQDGVTRWLTRSDSFEADHGERTWEYTRNVPRVYFDEDAPLLTLILAPVPSVAGVVIPLYTAEAPPLQALGDPLPVPDPSITALKYGTLADAFGKDGRGGNTEKAAYCEMRYRLDIDLMNVLLGGRV